MQLKSFHLNRKSQDTNLTKNPYLKDGLIWLPLVGVKIRLLKHTWDRPNKGFKFADFLLEYRPLQEVLAYHIIHTGTAAIWSYNPLKAEELILPNIDSKNRKFFPSKDWIRLVEDTKQALLSCEKHENIGQKKQGIQKLHNSLKELEKASLNQSDLWKHDYLKAIRSWIDESEKRLKELEHASQTYEPITQNIYRSGESLGPKEFGAKTFVGRKDLCNELSSHILNSYTMPSFLVQGQRRVGKTSLLKFLPELLGDRFIVLFIDMQSKEFITTSDCFKGFIKRGEKDSGFQYSKKGFPEDSLKAWGEFEDYFEKLAKDQNKKIIIAFDEYENLHKLIKKESEKGERLLEAMRSFSQHQNQVVLLFTGLYVFADLKEPDFSRYFVHTHRLKVDYLDKESCIKLITKPDDNFNLIYPHELVENMYELTNGHPGLLQHICYEMVNLANKNNRKEMNASDLEKVLEMVLDRGDPVITNFWIQFCNEPKSLKKTVFNIIRNFKTDNKPDLVRLLDYGFVVKQENGTYKMRVPLFEEWIKRYGESF